LFFSSLQSFHFYATSSLPTSLSAEGYFFLYLHINSFFFFFFFFFFYKKKRSLLTWCLVRYWRYAPLLKSAKTNYCTKLCSQLACVRYWRVRYWRGQL
jgi:hypothetical protein